MYTQNGTQNALTHANRANSIQSSLLSKIIFKLMQKGPNFEFVSKWIASIDLRYHSNYLYLRFSFYDIIMLAYFMPDLSRLEATRRMSAMPRYDSQAGRQSIFLLYYIIWPNSLLQGQEKPINWFHCHLRPKKNCSILARMMLQASLSILWGHHP